MILPFNINFRGVLLVSFVILGIGIFVIINNSKEKFEYTKSTGIIEYLDKEFQNLPTRNKADYRYLKINSYPYIFEIYKPNSVPTDKTIDDLQVGDYIDIYYYETADTRNGGINRYTQFIDSNEQSYFIRSSFQEQLGFILIGLSVLMILFAFVLWKKEKLDW
jgi:hypothetical protein